MADHSNSNSAGSGGGPYYYDQSAKFNPTTAVVIVSLIGGCFLLAFVSVSLRRCIRGESAARATQSTTQQQSGSYNGKSKGLEKAAVDALPLVHRADLDLDEDLRECPVCLTDFEPEEPLRLLPTCKHVFHQECIDAWFDAHSTCPLCRASLLGGAEANPQPQPVGEPVPESDIHYQPSSVPSTPPLDNELRTGAADSVPVSESAKDPSFRKPSMRSSSTLSADLIALRNLVLRQNDAPSRRWFTRARSLELGRLRDRAQDTREPEEWVTIDLETGKASAGAQGSSSSSSSSSSSLKAPERAWSERWSLVRFPLTRSTSDVSSRPANLPI